MTKPASAPITNLHVARDDDFSAAVLEGLGANPKRLYPRLLYDERGSRLFERICEQPEYYVTRIEMEVLRLEGRKIIDALDGEVGLIELGSGNSLKSRILLDHLSGRQGHFEYRPIDISEEILRKASQEIRADYPHISVHGFVADFLAGLEFLKLKTSRQRLILFLGSNLGNFEYGEALEFLGQIRRGAVPGDWILLGIDMDKDSAVIEPAYNDAAGFTEEFMLNLLDRINRELGGDFDRSGFRFRAAYNQAEKRMEIGIISRRNQKVFLRELDRTFRFSRGEWIEMEVSCKYTPARLRWLLREAGLQSVRQVSDSRGWFTLNLCRVP